MLPAFLRKLFLFSLVFDCFFSQDSINEDSLLFYKDDYLIRYDNKYYKYTGLVKKEDQENNIKKEYYMEDGKKDGLYLEYFMNGNKKYKAIYDKGIKIGLPRGWHENGTVSEEHHHTKEKQIKLCIEWYSNGKRKREYSYKTNENDIAEPIGGYMQWINGVMKFESGNYEGNFQTWYENGNKKDSCHYLNGAKIGFSKKWFRGGVLNIKENFKKGQINGKKEIWNENGTKVFEGTYLNGKKNGFRKRWFDNGQIHFQENYILNKKDSLSYKHGLSTSWYSNGVKGSEGEYRMGIKNGIFYTWKKNGDLESKKVFKYGNIVE